MLLEGGLRKLLALVVEQRAPLGGRVWIVADHGEAERQQSADGCSAVWEGVVRPKMDDAETRSQRVVRVASRVHRPSRGQPLASVRAAVRFRQSVRLASCGNTVHASRYTCRYIVAAPAVSTQKKLPSFNLKKAAVVAASMAPISLLNDRPALGKDRGP